jgi:release factor glutamine methyltransferase
MAPAIAAGRVQEALQAATDALAAAGVETPRLDAELLLGAAAGLDRARLAADPDAAVAPDAARRFGEMVRRRIRREPVAYILERKGFRRIELAVDRRALIPRPETELLVEIALELEPRTVLDVGTGSGAVALAVADELPGCEVTGTETSPGALTLAAENAERLGSDGRVRLERGTVPEGGRFDLVLANLPYVREDEWSGLAPEITRYEPREALVAGPDGTEVIASVVPAAAAALAPGGSLALEVGAGQAGSVAELLLDLGFGQVEGRQDLADIPRVVLARMDSA